jgi:hypothetical protein
MILAGTLFLSACSNDDETSDLDTKPQEFIANDDSFSGFQSWELVADHQGPDPALGAAHAGNDSTVTRYVYYKDDQERVNGAYPVGTIIVKESYNPDLSVHEFTAMVKRGHDFNPSGGDWEWFVLAGDGQIATDGDGNALRGADLMGGMCIGCHSQASDRDFAFSKP